MDIPLDTINEEKTITIQTHDKRFHADDVGAISLLTSYFNQKDTRVNIIRSRDLSLGSNILIDVGGIYDPLNGKFDHHQKDCNETYSNKFNIPLSSIGMVWKHYGKEILIMFLNSDAIEISSELCEDVYRKIILEIDAHDNGVSMVEGGKVNFQSNMNISSIISSMNTQDTNNEETQLQAFEEAVGLFGRIFEIKLQDIIRKHSSYQINQEIVKKYLVESEGEYLIVNEKLDNIYKSLNFLDSSYRIKFIIFNDTPGEITIRTRSRPENIYVPLVPLLSEEKLKNELGTDLVFVHKALFIGKTKSLESAIKVVELSLNKQVVSENVPVSYLNVRVPRTSGDWIKFGVLSGLISVSGILLYKVWSE